ncbi:CbrC family protein [Aquihabitans sp. G128]|uniref:CbrC family protein n=1 Tax=Aquihabitans sp. G128 TaxID=2849779 RepID=UPI001C23AD57|nr:CbrC family protein [Aquihabitans sp. G128]QXC61318.1 CbrC family protein [Aquihabitans sp. G128]
MTSEALPIFRYHPDPVATGAFEQRPTRCVGCGQDRGWAYAVTPYAEANLRDALCPWCVADGSAAATFGATFTELGEDVPAAIPQSVRDELAHRTPGFSAWQEERWLFHCDDAAAFLGAAGWDDVGHLPDAVAQLHAQAESWGFGREDAEAFVGSLDVDGDSTAYLFRCLHCGTHLAYADAG